MNFIKKNWQKLVLATYLLIIPVVSFAQNTESGVPCDKSGKICNPLSTTDTLPELIVKILNGAVAIGIPIVALAIIYCGFLFVSARGNSEKLTKAKGSLLWTLVGAAILLGSLAIAKMISSTVTAL